ncbi:MAG: hypothetical protein NTU81_01260 [Candidatus Nomurabacteria bacterium]|nr:hypothetical protein [Candidatus Nomurabacteria bacterium]
MESQTGIPAHKILKSLGLATVYESKALTLDLALSEFTNAPIFSAKREGALKRLNWFLLQAIKATSSYEGLIDLCSKCPSDSEAEKAAITKLAKTFF